MRLPVTLSSVVMLVLLLTVSTLTAAPRDKASDAFRDVARKMFVEILPELPQKERKNACEALMCAPNELASKFAELLVQNSPSVFRVTAEEAEEIMNGRFDNRGNRERVELAAEVLEPFKTQLPRPTTYWMEKHSAGNIPRGIKLEFAARFLGAQARSVKSALDREGRTRRG